MKIARNTSLFTLIAAAVLLIAGVACGGGSDKQDQTASPSATDTASPTATPSPTPSPTPTPFAGGVAKMSIPKLGVNAPVEPLTVNNNNEMDTPTHGRENTYVGWYDSTIKPTAPFLGVKPGWDGNAVFAAHVYYISSAACPNNPRACPAPFQKLTTLKPGDEVDVAMDGGPTYKYRVLTYTQYNRDTIPMGDIISPPTQPKDKQWITLITCGGDLDSSGLEYISREVVVAERYE